MQPRLLRACRRQPVDATPIWLMRQAGRYLPDYRALRERHGFLEMVKTPELACEVTLQPLRLFDLDAAIVFADILPPLESLGFELEFAEGHGPVIRNPLRSAAAAGALAWTESDEGWLLHAGGDPAGARRAGRHCTRSSDSAAPRSPSPATRSRAAAAETSRPRAGS